MRVAVDVRELCGRPTGVGRYLAGLLDAWSDNAAAQRHQWALYAHARPTLPGRWDEHFRLVEGGGGTTWEQCSLPAALARRPARCAVRAGVHCTPHRGCPRGPDRSRRLVLCPPGMVFVPRGHAAPAAHRVVGAPRAPGDHRLGVFAIRDRAPHRHRRDRASRVIPLGIDQPTAGSARSRGSAEPREPLGALRRLDLRATPRRSIDRSVRRGRRAGPECAARDRRRKPDASSAARPRRASPAARACRSHSHPLVCR